MVLLQESNEWQCGVMMNGVSYCYQPEADYFPTTASPELFLNLSRIPQEFAKGKNF